MNCPYLQGTYLQSCKATREVYIPSQFEFREYCANSAHKMCPSYTKSINEGDSTVKISADRRGAGARISL